ncbi:unnamed protein product [Acanthosepion pharaonis]|uniref:Uncharacterized protein n=1 Tax=Acanthosepion pharaonis TaxID=158019 RepID=A0A812CMH0_ACAPH|nr:unnamed protein product [Sepia pharaonis]
MSFFFFPNLPILFFLSFARSIVFNFFHSFFLSYLVFVHSFYLSFLIPIFFIYCLFLSLFLSLYFYSFFLLLFNYEEYFPKFPHSPSVHVFFLSFVHNIIFDISFFFTISFVLRFQSFFKFFLSTYNIFLSHIDYFIFFLNDESPFSSFHFISVSHRYFRNIYASFVYVQPFLHRLISP